MAEIGIVGLGKMGANMAERLRRAGHEVVGFDHDKASSRDVANLSELVQALPTPRVGSCRVLAKSGGENGKRSVDANRAPVRAAPSR